MTLLSHVDVEDVLIKTMGIEISVDLEAGVPYFTTLSSSLHTIDGLEDKGIIVSSNVELLVIMMKLDLETPNARFIDTYEAFDQRLAGHDYFLLAPTHGCSNSI